MVRGVDALGYDAAGVGAENGVGAVFYQNASVTVDMGFGGAYPRSVTRIGRPCG